MMRIAAFVAPALLLIARSVSVGANPPPPREGHVKPGQPVSELLEASAPGERSALPPTQLDWGAIGKLGLGAFALAVTGAGIVLVHRRWARGALRGASGIVEILERVPLSSRHIVFVLRCGERRVVVGVSGDRMTPLATYEESPVAMVSRASRCEPSGTERRQEPESLPVREADLLPYRRQVNRLRALLRGRESLDREAT